MFPAAPSGLAQLEFISVLVINPISVIREAGLPLSVKN